MEPVSDYKKDTHYKQLVQATVETKEAPSSVVLSGVVKVLGSVLGLALDLALAPKR